MAHIILRILSFVLIFSTVISSAPSKTLAKIHKDSDPLFCKRYNTLKDPSNNSKREKPVIYKDLCKMTDQDKNLQKRFNTTLDKLGHTEIKKNASFTSPLKGRAEVNWRYSNNRSILMTEFWSPLIQGSEGKNVLYGDLRIMGDNADNREGNLGIGYRHITKSPLLGDGILGANAWIDHRITNRESRFNQLTLGTEWLGLNVDVRLNGYIPLTKEKEHIVPAATAQGASFSGTGILVTTDGKVIEEAQRGADLEFGLELGQHINLIKKYTDSTRLYTGGYYFRGDKTNNVAGWRTRLAADITPNLQIGARFQKDNQRGSQGFLEATFRFPINNKKSYRNQGLRARLDESPERDIDIVTNEAVTESGNLIPVLNKSTGLEQEVLHVDNTAPPGGDGSIENPFDSLVDAETAASAETIIYVARGDGTDTNQNQGITLNQQGQQLIGSGTNFIYDNAKFTTSNKLTPNTNIIRPATAAPIISNSNLNGDGITVNADNVTIAGISVIGSNRDGIAVKADGIGASAQNITIQDVTTQSNRMGIYIHGTNNGAVSTKIQNTTATGNSQHGIAVYDDTSNTFEADLGGGTMNSVGRNILANNTLEDLAIDYDGRTLAAMNNWWGQATGPDTDTPDIGITPQIYYGAPINDGLVGNWTFDNEWTTNTTAYDRSGQSNDGTLQGTLSLANQVAGQNREALNFDGGPTTNITIPHTASLLIPDEISVLTWINGSPQVTTPWARFIVKDGGGIGWFLSARSNTANSHARVDTTGGFNDTVLVTGGLDNNWNQYALTMDTGIMETYMNLNNISNPYNHGTGFSNTSNISIGSNQFIGSLDEIRIYNRAIDPSEISELYRMDTSSTVNTSNFLSTTP